MRLILWVVLVAKVRILGFAGRYCGEIMKKGKH